MPSFAVDNFEWSFVCRLQGWFLRILSDEHMSAITQVFVNKEWGVDGILFSKVH